MNYLEKTKNEAVQNHTRFRRKRKDDFCLDLLITEFCGYKSKYLNREPFFYKKPEFNRYISLAMYDFTTKCLGAYKSKLPILCINAYRLEYTVDAFKISGKTNIISDPLEFYLNFEIKRINMNLDPNERFSMLLHSLKKSGSEEYVYQLANYLDFNFDIIKRKNYVYRYVNIKQSKNIHAPSFGVLTGAKVDSDWIVQPTLGFITKTNDID